MGGSERAREGASGGGDGMGWDGDGDDGKARQGKGRQVKGRDGTDRQTETRRDAPRGRQFSLPSVRCFVACYAKRLRAALSRSIIIRLRHIFVLYEAEAELRRVCAEATEKHFLI